MYVRLQIDFNPILNESSSNSQGVARNEIQLHDVLVIQINK